MIELKGMFKNLAFTPENKVKVLLEVDMFELGLLDSLKNKTLKIRLSENKERRSLDANAYLWHLCNEIANVMRISKEEVYLNLLQHYGQSSVILMLSKIDPRGYFKYYTKMDEIEKNGVGFTYYKVYKGSSEYDTKEMSILIDGAVQEAKGQGIQVLSDSDIALLKDGWGK